MCKRSGDHDHGTGMRKDRVCGSSSPWRSGARALIAGVLMAAELTGFGGEIVWDTSKPNGYPRRKLDTTRAETLFGFRARTPLREGIARTVAWYRASAPTYAAR